MDGLSMPLMIIGVAVALIGGIRLIISAFSTSVLWGIGVIVFHPIVLLYVLLNWHEAKGPFVNYIGGIAIVLFGASLGN